MTSLGDYANQIPVDSLVQIIQYNVQNPKNQIQGVVFLPQGSNIRDGMRTLEQLSSHPTELYNCIPSHIGNAVTARQIAHLPSASVPFTYIPLDRIVAERYWSLPERSEERAKLSPNGVPMPPM